MRDGWDVVDTGGMLSGSDRLIAEFDENLDPATVIGVVAHCEGQLREQGLPDAALPELVERLARADMLEHLTASADSATHHRLPRARRIRPGVDDHDIPPV